MNIQLKNQLLYIITNEELGYEEYNLPYSSFYSSHLETYSDFLLANPELDLGFTLDRGLPEQLNTVGMVVYQGFGPTNEKYREMFYNFKYSGGLLLPKNFTKTQKQKLIKKLHELKEIYIEFSYFENDKYNIVHNDGEYLAYQKLKKILYTER